MKLRTVSMAIFAAAIQIFALSHVNAGGEGNVGGGTDQLPLNHGSAWFTGRQNHIRYCTVVDGNFGASADFAEERLVAAYAQWDRYLDRILNKYHNLTTTLKRMRDCDGTEDLKIYFGTTSDEVAKEKARYFNPIAFSHRTHFSEDKGWGKGFIWIGSGKETNVDWSLSNNLLGIVLHEVGHVFGCSHVDGTIMRPDNGHLLRPDGDTDWDARGQRLLGQIDGERQLFLASGVSFDYPGRLAYGYGKGYNRPDTTQIELERIARVFLKRPLHGKAEARVASTDKSYKETYQYSIRITDEDGTVVIPLTFTRNHDWAARPFETRFDRGGVIFNTVGPGIGSMFSSMGMWAYGTADLGEGKNVPIILERNMSSILSLKYLAEDGIHNLFMTTY